MSMEPAYHLPPILSPIKGVRTNQSNCFRGKETGKTQLPPLKRVVTPAGIEKEKITTPRPEHDQQHVAKKKRKKKRNRGGSHDPSAVESEIHELALLSQSATQLTRNSFQPSFSSPNVYNRHLVVEENQEFHPQTALDLSYKYGDELQGETFSRIGEPYLRNGAKRQGKARNAKARNLEQQKGIQANHIDDENARINYVQTTVSSFSSKDNGASQIQENSLAVLSSDQCGVRREGKEEYLEEVGWTDKSFHQKRRGTRIVQSKEHPHSVHPLEFHPHPPSQFRPATCKTPITNLTHPNLPAIDSRLNSSGNGHSQVRQVCMHGGSISSVTSQFQPHPPLQPRSFVSPIRQFHSTSEYTTIPLEGQTSSSGQLFQNTSTFTKTQPLFPMDSYPDRCPEPRTLCKNIGHHSYRNVGSSPVVSGFAPHISRDYLMQSQLCLPTSPVSKNCHYKTPNTFYSNRVIPVADMNQGQDVLQYTAFSGLNNEGPNVSGQQSYFPTGFRLPANYQWAIIDDAGSVTPLPPGSFPAASKKDSEESNEKSPDSPEGSYNSFPPASPSIPVLHLPNIKEPIVEELPELQVSKAPSTFLEFSSANAPPMREQQCLGVGSDEERPPERIFEKVPPPTNAHWKKKRAKGASMNTNQTSCKPFTPSVLDPDEEFLTDSPRVNRSSPPLTEMPNENMEGMSPEQSNASVSPNGEKKQRNFKLPKGWCSNSKSWFKSPFKKEKKHHRKTSSMPPQNGHLPPLLTIDEFSSLNISEENNSRPPETAKGSADKKKTSVYTLGEFLKLCDEDEEDTDGIY